LRERPQDIVYVIDELQRLAPDVPRAYVEIAGMGHTPSASDEIALVLHYAAALLRYYLKGDRATGRGLAAASANATVKGSGLPQ
jgi:hypothetical protein